MSLQDEEEGEPSFPLVPETEDEEVSSPSSAAELPTPMSSVDTSTEKQTEQAMGEASVPNEDQAGDASESHHSLSASHLLPTLAEESSDESDIRKTPASDDGVGSPESVSTAPSRRSLERGKSRPLLEELKRLPSQRHWEQPVTVAEPKSLFRRFRLLCGRVVENPTVQVTVIVLIIVNALMMGIGTFDFVTENPFVLFAFEAVDTAFLVVFTLEIALQLCYRFLALFMDGWLVFDFVIVVASWSLESLQIVRAFRIFRAFRLVTRIGPLRELVMAIAAVMPRMYAIAMLLIMIFYIYAVLFTELFGDLVLSEDYFTRLDASLFTCMELMTLEWADVARQVMEQRAWAWAPIVSFIAVTGFIVFNLIVAVVCDAVAVVDRECRAEERAELEEHVVTEKDMLDDTQCRVWDLSVEIEMMRARQQQMHNTVTMLAREMLAMQEETELRLGLVDYESDDPSETFAPESDASAHDVHDGENDDEEESSEESEVLESGSDSASDEVDPSESNNSSHAADLVTESHRSTSSFSPESLIVERQPRRGRRKSNDSSDDSFAPDNDKSSSSLIITARVPRGGRRWSSLTNSEDFTMPPQTNNRSSSTFPASENVALAPLGNESSSSVLPEGDAPVSAPSSRFSLSSGSNSAPGSSGQFTGEQSVDSVEPESLVSRNSTDESERSIHSIQSADPDMYPRSTRMGSWDSSSARRRTSEFGGRRAPMATASQRMRRRRARTKLEELLLRPRAPPGEDSSHTGGSLVSSPPALKSVLRSSSGFDEPRRRVKRSVSFEESVDDVISNAMRMARQEIENEAMREGEKNADEAALEPESAAPSLEDP